MVRAESTATESPRPRVGISSCLLGETVRYDGGHKRDRFITDVLGPCVEWVRVCPEVEVGMGVPRPAIRLEGSPSQPRLIEPESGEDWTARMVAWSRHRLENLKTLHLSGYILKEDSPSCGMQGVRVFSRSGGTANRRGRGVFAAALLDTLPLLPVEDEGRLKDPVLRENFIERVFAFDRWQRLCRERKSRGRLVDFHAAHKLQLLAHSETHMRSLGRLVARAAGRPLPGVYDSYGTMFMEALECTATRQRHTNVLQHMAGHVSDRLEARERADLLSEIDDYRRGLVPLHVPLTLIRDYVRTFDVSTLQHQTYLDPHPRELLLQTNGRLP